MVVLIPVSVATAFSMSLVPGDDKSLYSRKCEVAVQTFYEDESISSRYYGTSGDWNDDVSKTGIYSLFGAGNDPEMGSIILQYYAPACILFSLLQ